MTNYLRCQQCGHESTKTEAFNDLQLTISTVDGGGDSGPRSIETMLRDMLTPEALDGGNQWHCPQCDTKVDALKGSSFEDLSHLPPV